MSSSSESGAESGAESEDKSDGSSSVSLKNGNGSQQAQDKNSTEPPNTAAPPTHPPHTRARTRKTPTATHPPPQHRYNLRRRGGAGAINTVEMAKTNTDVSANTCRNTGAVFTTPNENSHTALECLDSDIQNDLETYMNMETSDSEYFSF